MRDTVILYDILVTGIELPAAIIGAINRSGRARKTRVGTQKDRGRRLSRFPTDCQPRHFGILSALPRHRSNASAVAVDEFEGGRHRQREGRVAGHSWRCRSASARRRGARGAGTTVAGKERRPRTPRCRWRKRRLQDWRRRPKRYRLVARVLRLPPTARARAHFGRSTCRISRHTSPGL